MRPTPAAAEAANPTPRSRKSSIVGDRRPSVSSTAPTSFFLAREEDVFKSSSSGSERRGSAHSSKADAGGKATDEAKVNPDSMFGVQSLEEALGAAFGRPKETNEEDVGQQAPGGLGLAGLLKRKRSTKEPSNSNCEANKAPANEAAVVTSGTTEDVLSSKHSSPQRLNSNTLPTLHTPQRNSRTNTISAPLTPLQMESPFPESAIPSTPKSGSFRSLRLSDGEEDEAASQAITSGGEEEEEEDDERDGEGEEAVAGSMAEPQLVMPSLAMPSRRPFTERGKQMGRLKVAVAGASGVGKTSLIRAIVRQCEDIVHLDPLTTAPTTSTTTIHTPTPGKRPRKAQHITEIQASTKAYPPWWSDMEDSRVLRRRKSMGETVLERNISFIDSPGFSSSREGELKTEKLPLVGYLEGLFQRNAAMDGLDKSELLGVLSGAGGVQVDIVLYICAPAESLTQHDFAYMAALSKYVTVIPILAKADASPEAELARRKQAIAHELPRCNINGNVLSRPSTSLNTEPGQTPMPQDPAASSYLGDTNPQVPFLVSSLPGSDDGEMDASLLMSPSYSPPLMSSELQALVSMLFHPETMSKLRHISARKFLHWREKAGLDATPDPDALALITSSPTAGMGIGIKDQLALARAQPQRRSTDTTITARHNPFNLSSTSSPLSSIGQGLPDFSRARIRDHIAREERLAQVQLAKWAADLQRNIRREREEYARLVEGERARWLLKRVGEEAASGHLSPLSSFSSSDDSLLARERRRIKEGDMRLPTWSQRRGRDEADPLGIVAVAEGVGRTGGLVLKALGGGVLVGAVWVAVCRAWGWELNGEGRWWGGWFGW